MKVVSLDLEYYILLEISVFTTFGELFWRGFNLSLDFTSI